MIEVLPALGIAGFFAILFARARRNSRALPKLQMCIAESTPDCMVVIPARDEERSIGRAVRSFPPDTVIVVDDDSSDVTSEEARQAGAGVLPAPALPKGAAGKAHACMVGARVLTSEWILFADADTWYEKHFLESAVAFAAEHKLDFLSIHLDPEAQSWAEKILVPYLAALLFSREPIFRGQCLLVRRECYEFVGGHGAVLQHVTEDVKLAGVAVRHRLRLSVASSGGLGHVRLYEGWRGIWDGFARTAFRFTQVHPRGGLKILAKAACWALWFPCTAWLWLANQHLAAGVLAVLPLALWPWYGSRRVWLAPVAIYLALPFVLHGCWGAMVYRPVQWKGRTTT